MSREIVTRRNLPHWYVPGAMHFVTFRLAGTLPREVVDDLKRRKQSLLVTKTAGVAPAEHRQRIHKQIFAAYDAYLDRHCEIDWLRDPRIAALVRSSLYHLHGRKHLLLAYSIMPNHVHVLIQPIGLPKSEDGANAEECDDSSGPLAEVMHSLKGYTAHQANKILGRSGAFWQHESYDHWVRDEEELERIVEYINANAVNAHLATRPVEYFWSSAHDRFLTDGDASGWLNLPVEQASSLAHR